MASLQLSTLVVPASLLLLLFYGAGTAHCSMVHGNTTDRRSLLDFKEAITDDPTGGLRSWNDSIQHCTWSGVQCSTRHPGRVTELILYHLNLTGPITPSLGNLTFLRELDLSFNRFSGHFPPLNRLRKLETLNLGTNFLQGNIPDALTKLRNYSKLEWLDLSFNMLVGTIPRNIDSLSNLVGITLSANNLTGYIPQTFSNITHLVDISIRDNQLEGSIPEELGQLANMSFMFLDGNRLSGRVPAALFNLSQLALLELKMNVLSGHIPDSPGNASGLVLLDLSSNYFTGQIPSYTGGNDVSRPGS